MRCLSITVKRNVEEGPYRTIWYHQATFKFSRPVESVRESGIDQSQQGQDKLLSEDPMEARKHMSFA
jgi:hypothetical protein